MASEDKITTTTTTNNNSSKNDPPPGVEEGGIWGVNSYVGSKTGAIACLGCLCFCIPGLLVLFCPMDERDAYKVKGKVYDAEGKLLGNVPDIKFVATR
mmetsp:Transcript_18205/g.27773  ORF Transcript_18205/g.27773 Transcript_18205/m.27773 type:complete len:98 (+) Transcript_18205:44-337(+)